MLGDLGGRSVWQVLVLYLGASWGVLEVVDVLKENASTHKLVSLS